MQFYVSCRLILSPLYLATLCSVTLWTADWVIQKCSRYVHANLDRVTRYHQVSYALRVLPTECRVSNFVYSV
jgi:hypothetical protein